MKVHPSHKVRVSIDASTYDEICEVCGATDTVGSGMLCDPCPAEGQSKSPEIPSPDRLEAVNHPPHYGGDSTYEAIKVIEAWELGFCLGNCVKYICRADKKGTRLEDLEKALWYLQHEVDKLKKNGGLTI